MKKLLLKSILLLCALITGTSAWAQGDYSATYTSNVTLSGGSSCTVVINSTDYDGTKLGSNGKGGSCTFSAPAGTKYLHLHVAAWNNKSTTFTYKVGTADAVSISNITSNSGIANSSPFTFSGDANSTNYYKVITLATALENATTITLASGSERVVIWGVNTEAQSSDPSSSAAFANTTPEINYPATKTYSQAPTTATGYSGTISYSMTANTAGASINSTTGVVTVTKGGSVTVKAIAAAVPGSFSGSEASYTLTVNDTRASADLAWSAASADVTYGAVNVFPTLTNTHNVTVTYASTNQAAASIDENTGMITLKDYNGSTDISAIFAGDDDYKEQTVTYTLNVSKAPFSIKDGIFDFVEAATAGEDYGSGVTTTSTSSEYVTTNKTWIAGNVTMVTSKVSGSGYRWWSADGTLRFYNGSKATFSVPSGYVITKIVTTGANFDNATVGTLSGSTWTGASDEVALSVTGTRNVKTITVTYTTENQTFNPAKEYTTLTSAYNLDFTGLSLKAYIATEVSGGAVQMTQVNKVPANTGLVLKATNLGNAVEVPVFDGTSPDDVSGNKMAGSATATTEIAENAGYILSNGVFQPATAGTLAAGKAYLNIAVSARELVLNFDESDVTAISEVTNTNCTNNTNVYDLQGRKVAQPTKGLYIVNGKKVVIK